jgi:hypothetical protein
VRIAAIERTPAIIVLRAASRMTPPVRLPNPAGLGFAANRARQRPTIG